MAKNAPIGIGIVGLGRAGYGMHVKELTGREDKFKIVAGCDTASDRRERFQQRCGCSAYSDVRELIDDPAVELVDVATRSNDHCAHACAALKAGKDVFLEKPIALNLAEARKIAAAAEKSGAKVYFRHNRRFEAAFNTVMDVVKSRKLGEVYEIRLVRFGYTRRDDWQTLLKFGGGQLANWGPHIIDHALHLLGSPLKDLWSNLRRVAAVGDAEDHVHLIFTGENGRIVDMTISGGAAARLPHYMVLGTKGSLVHDGKTMTLKYLDPKVKLPKRKANPANPGDKFGTPEELPWIEENVPLGDGNLSVIWDHLYDAIRKGKKFPISTQEALDVMAVIDRARKGTEFKV